MNPRIQLLEIRNSIVVETKKLQQLGDSDLTNKLALMRVNLEKNRTALEGMESNAEVEDVKTLLVQFETALNKIEDDLIKPNRVTQENPGEQTGIARNKLQKEDEEKRIQKQRQKEELKDSTGKEAKRNNLNPELSYSQEKRSFIAMVHSDNEKEEEFKRIFQDLVESSDEKKELALDNYFWERVKNTPLGIENRGADEGFGSTPEFQICVNAITSLPCDEETSRIIERVQTKWLTRMGMLAPAFALAQEGKEAKTRENIILIEAEEKQRDFFSNLKVKYPSYIKVIPLPSVSVSTSSSSSGLPNRCLLKLDEQALGNLSNKIEATKAELRNIALQTDASQSTEKNRLNSELENLENLQKLKSLFSEKCISVQEIEALVNETNKACLLANAYGNLMGAVINLEKIRQLGQDVYLQHSARTIAAFNSQKFFLPFIAALRKNDHEKIQFYLVALKKNFHQLSNCVVDDILASNNFPEQITALEKWIKYLSLLSINKDHYSVSAVTTGLNYISTHLRGLLKKLKEKNPSSYNELLLYKNKVLNWEKYPSRFFESNNVATCLPPFSTLEFFKNTREFQPLEGMEKALNSQGTRDSLYYNYDLIRKINLSDPSSVSSAKKTGRLKKVNKLKKQLEKHIHIKERTLFERYVNSMEAGDVSTSTLTVLTAGLFTLLVALFSAIASLFSSKSTPSLKMPSNNGFSRERFPSISEIEESTLSSTAGPISKITVQPTTSANGGLSLGGEATSTEQLAMAAEIKAGEERHLATAPASAPSHPTSTPTPPQSSSSSSNDEKRTTHSDTSASSRRPSLGN